MYGRGIWDLSIAYEVSLSAVVVVVATAAEALSEPGICLYLLRCSVSALALVVVIRDREWKEREEEKESKEAGPFSALPVGHYPRLRLLFWDKQGPGRAGYDHTLLHGETKAQGRH